MNLVGLPITPGSGAYVGANLVNESGQDRYIQRITPNTSEGEDVSVGSSVTIDVTVTRPADTNQYTGDDAWSNSTTTPTASGFQFPNAARLAGKSGLITDLYVFGSAAQATQLQGELWLFDSAVTNINDNSAFSLSITDLRKLVAKLPFTLAAAGGGASLAEVAGINKGFTAVGTPDLRGLIKVKNLYTPVSSEALTFRLKVMRTN